MIFNIDSLYEAEKAKIKEEVSNCKVTPRLAIIKTSSDDASFIYMRNKLNLAKELGIDARMIDCSGKTTEEVIETIRGLTGYYNQVQEADGLIVQLPMSDGMDEKAIMQEVPYRMDVDGFSPWNIGGLMLGEENRFVSCTPLGIVKILEARFGDSLAGKNVVVINRSNIVGKPLVPLLLTKDCTVTVCHSKTKDLHRFLLNADIIISAVGKPNFIERHMLKKDSFVVDVSINRGKDGKVCGDCSKSLYDENLTDIEVTRVPRGVGRMTVLMLMHNTVQAAKK